MDKKGGIYMRKNIKRIMVVLVLIILVCSCSPINQDQKWEKGVEEGRYSFNLINEKKNTNLLHIAMKSPKFKFLSGFGDYQ